jgi:hypothetical protein
MFHGFDHRVSRPVTNRILDLVDEGMFDKDRLIADLLGWMSEADVAAFARANDLLIDEDDELEDE